jgi:cholest-4-en-3-one 26-monooxygenase
VRGIVTGILDGGAETTRTVIGSMVRELALQPAQRRILIERPGLLAETAVEEFIRWVSPISNMRRIATTGHDRHGQRIQAGDEVLLLYGAANRDPRAFSSPDILDVTRPFDIVIGGTSPGGAAGRDLAGPLADLG